MSKSTEHAALVPADIDRRTFVAGAAAVIATAGLCSRARAQDLPQLDPADPTAVALKYVADASNADAALRKEGANCSNCVLFTGADDADWAPCSIFPGKQVNANGWCSVWASKPDA